MNVSNKQNIFLISGKVGVGKSSFAIACDTICKHMAFNSQVIAFADELKRIAMNLGWDRKKDEKGRKFLIDLGLAARNYDLDIWAKTLWNGIDDFADFIFVDDWRFINEYEFFNQLAKDPANSLQLFLIRIESPEREALKGSKLYNDESEIGLDNFDKSLYNYIIVNDGTLEDLYNKALDVIKEVKKNLKIW